MDVAVKEENKFDYVTMIEDALNNINTIKVNDSIDKEFEILL